MESPTERGGVQADTYRCARGLNSAESEWAAGGEEEARSHETRQEALGVAGFRDMIWCGREGGRARRGAICGARTGGGPAGDRRGGTGGRVAALQLARVDDGRRVGLGWAKGRVNLRKTWILYSPA